MTITGIICEYNPLHLGHKKQLDTVRALHGPDCGIVCLMSGNFVQRGAPAIIDKSLRARAAVLSGADLVLELPITATLSSAEGFAAQGVAILSALCHDLCFGAETKDPAALMHTARALLSPNFSLSLRSQLDKGLSFPAARQQALEAQGLAGDILAMPNNILAIEYCKAILAQRSPMKPLPIFREGSYHDTLPDPENPSATALRSLMSGDSWKPYVPEAAAACFQGASLHTLEAGQRAILGKLRTMREADFEALPYGSEGLWRKLMHESRRQNTLEDILTAVKSKRYTRSRLDRMMMCAFLGITADMLQTPAPYVRILAFNGRGRQILRQYRGELPLCNAGQAMDGAYSELEARAGDLYGLFAQGQTEAPGAESSRRVVYLEDA